jgi:hypothetical protein
MIKATGEVIFSPDHGLQCLPLCVVHLACLLSARQAGGGFQDAGKVLRRCGARVVLQQALIAEGFLGQRRNPVLRDPDVGQDVRQADIGHKLVYRTRGAAVGLALGESFDGLAQRLGDPRKLFRAAIGEL